MTENIQKQLEAQDFDEVDSMILEELDETRN
jgi:hypothetical protein